MSTPPIASAEANVKSGSSNSPVGIERRRRKRAKITAQVHMRGVNTPEPFEEICKSVDVSRDGLLVTSARAGYWKGQRLEVVFPYSTAAAALNSSQPAEIVRVVEQDGRYAVALQFINTKSDAAAKVDPSVADVRVSGNALHAKQQSVVLAVESDPQTAEIIRNILSNDGYTVIIVPTAQQALDILRNTGAVVCIPKPFNPERLLHVVRLVAPPPTARSASGASL